MSSPVPSSQLPDWTQSSFGEAQLSVDVFREGEELVVRATVAGVRPEDIDISINEDLLTIRGSRKSERETSGQEWFYRECYWGSFSRSIVLPHEVATDAARATLKNGVLEIHFPIRAHGKKVAVEWSEE